jgi:hypothetical protein
MRSTFQLLKAAQATMLKWPAIWLPTFMISALQLMASGPYMNVVAQGFVMLTTNMGVFLIEAGWLSIIARALNEQPIRMEDFQTGVNQHWASFVAGNIAFYLLIAGLFGGAIAIGNSLYGMDGIEHWVKGLEGLTPEKLNAMLRPELVPAPVKGWMSLMAVWMGLVVLTAFLLLFWQPVVALRGVGWWRGWLGSMTLVFNRFPQALAVAVLHLFMLIVSLGIVTAGSALSAMLGLCMLLLVTTYFKALYATFVFDAWPPAVDAHA